MPRRNTDQKKRRFLLAIERGMFVSQAAQYASVDRTTPYVWETSDPEFSQSWSRSREIRLRQLTDTAMDLALDGSEFMLRFLINRHDKRATNEEAATIGEISIQTAEAPSDELPTDSPVSDFLTFEPA